MASVKIYRRHYCSRNHRSYQTIAKCLWKRAAWIVGEGPYASLAHCRVLTVKLFSSLEEAEASKAEIDSTGCGGMCQRRHEIVRLLPPDQMESE